MSELISDTAIKKATGVTWQIWVDRLDQMGARDLPHKEIATKLITDYHVAGWWAQALTVRYEQHIGRRHRGQSNNGDFSISVAKTVPGTLDGTFQWWLKKVQMRTEFNNIAIISSSKTETERWRYYRAALRDGSRVIVSIYAKAPQKVGVGLRHEKIASGDSSETWRTYWMSILSDD